MSCRPIAILIWVFICLGWSALGRAQVQRPLNLDSQKADQLQSLLCSQGKDTNQGPDALWPFGIFDAQIEGLLLEREGGGKAATEELNELALQTARNFHHRSFMWGKCEGKRYWLLTFPAPAPLGELTDSLTIPTDAWANACKAVRVQFAPAKQPEIRRLPIKKQVVSLKGLGDGAIAVECEPKEPKWLGPQLFYLAPVGKGVPGLQQPKGQSRLSEADLAREMIAWLQQKRSELGRSALEVDNGLNRGAATLSESDRIHHDRRALVNVGLDLQEKQKQLLGEDRVMGNSLADLSWQLWTSPSHRALLMESSAKYLGLHARKSERGGFLVVLIVAKDSSPDVRTALEIPAKK